MSSRPSPNSSPSNSPEHSSRCTTSANLGSLDQKVNFDDNERSEEAPQHSAGSHPQSTAPDLSSRSSTTSDSRPAAPLIVITESPQSPNNQEAESTDRSSRPLVARHTSRDSSSQPPRRSSTPYARPVPRTRAHSQPRSVETLDTSTMSSASSSPGNTSTAGATSGSGTSNQLPYAPFPYPMPANGRGGQGQQGGSSSGK